MMPTFKFYSFGEGRFNRRNTLLIIIACTALAVISYVGVSRFLIPQFFPSQVQIEELKVVEEMRVVPGIVKSIQGDSFLLELYPYQDRGTGLTIRKVTFNPDTKVTKRGALKDREVFIAEIAEFESSAYGSNADMSEEVREARKKYIETHAYPDMYEYKEVAVSALKVGQNVVVFASSDIMHRESFIAESIRIESDPPSMEAPAASSGNREAVAHKEAPWYMRFLAFTANAQATYPHTGRLYASGGTSNSFWCDSGYVLMRYQNSFVDTFGGSSVQGVIRACVQIPPPPTYVAACTGITVPTSVVAGQSFSASVTMRNDGNIIWTPIVDPNAYKLGSQDLQDNTDWGAHRTPLPHSVAPGSSVTFNWNPTAPLTTGTKTFSREMLQESVRWFQNGRCSASITVTVPLPSSPTLTASCSAGTATLSFGSTGGTSYDYRVDNTTLSSTFNNACTPTFAGDYCGNTTNTFFNFPGVAGSNYTLWMHPCNITGCFGQATVLNFFCPATTAPTVTTPTVASITTTSATLGATVTSNGGAALTARGTCWGTTTNPTTNCLAEGGTTVSVFTHSSTGMTANTLYYYRGYATNSVGTGYSTSGSFTTSAAPCSATTIANCTLPLTNSSLSAGSCSAGYSGACSYSCSNGTWSLTSNSCTPATCANGANNPPTCNTCTAPSVWNTSSLSCVAPLSVTANAIASITLPTTAFTSTYSLTNGTSANTNCRLLDNVGTALTTYSSCTGSIVYNTPAVAGTYGYHVQANKSSTGETRTSAMVTVTVNATATCANGANNPPTCNTCTAPSVWNTSSLSCVAPLSVTANAIASITLPTTAFTSTYSLTNGTSANTNCRLLDNVGTALTTYSSCTGSIAYNTPAVAGTYGYYVQANKSSTGETRTSAMVTVTVNAAAAANCTSPWGTTVLHNASVTAFQSSSVVSPATCVSQTRTCTNGTLSGSYTNQSCSVVLPPPSADISASLSRVRVGDSVTITWSSSNATSCSVTGPGISSTALSGSLTVTINGQSTYTITCQTNGSPVTNSVTVTANVSPVFEEF